MDELNQEKLKLPTSVEEFIKVVDELIKMYPVLQKDSDKRHVSAVVALATRHLPAGIGFTTYDYFYQWVIRSIANTVTQYISDSTKHEMQVENLEGMIKQDPNNQQLWDELKKAADQGSEKAKFALKRLEDTRNPSEPGTVIPIKGHGENNDTTQNQETKES